MWYDGIWHDGMWYARANDAYDATANALNLLYSELNQGQQNKVLKNEEVKNMLVFYGVVKEEN